MAIKRTAYRQLNNWKLSIYRKPLILRGARQVGKTTLAKEFSKSYSQSVLLNLEKSDDLSYFIDQDNVREIIESLFLSYNISTEKMSDTLLFIDEIQESPKTIQLLRYFYEELPELHVIAAGSLLEFAIKDVPSFPVGRVEFLYLYPLNFMEYIDAIGHTSALEQLNSIPLNPIAHRILLDLFNRYVIIGGMPEVIKVYLDTKSIADLPKVYESIWATYKEDVEKYTSNETERKVIKLIISVAHLYIDQRIKFQNFADSNYKSREVGDALRNLDQANIIRLIYPSTDVEAPIRIDLKKSPRLQFLDTGLVNYSLGIQASMISLKDLGSSHKGSIIPHMINQELMSINHINNKKPSFWVRDKKQASAEVDLIYQYDNKIIPIEIKSGSEGKLKSLHQFMERTNHPYAIRMYAGEFRIDKTKTPGGTPYYLMNLPYYLGTKIPDYVEFFVNNYSLT